MVAQAFEHAGQWAGYRVHRARTGWVVEGWSQIQGSRTGWRRLIPFGLGVDRGTDLSAESVPFGRVGDHVASLAAMGLGRVLRRGITVH